MIFNFSCGRNYLEVGSLFSLVADTMQYHKYPISLWHRLKAGAHAFLTNPHTEKPISIIVDDYLALKSNRNTRRAYRIDLRQFLSFLNVSDQTLGSLVSRTKPKLQSEIQQFLNDKVKRDLLDEYVINGWTLNRKLFTVIGFFRYLQDTYDFPFNPAINLPPFPVPKESNSPKLTESEIRYLMSVLKQRKDESVASLRNYLIILGLFHFALRRRELAKLQWQEIQKAPVPHFRLRQKGNTFKYLPIPDEYMALLEAYKKQNPSKSPFIFRPVKNNVSKSLDSPISTEGIRHVVSKVAEEFFPDRGIVPHSFRATFICLARQYKIDDKSILNTTGQSSSRILNFYDTREKLITNAVLFFGVWIGQY